MKQPRLDARGCCWTRLRTSSTETRDARFAVPEFSDETLPGPVDGSRFFWGGFSRWQTTRRVIGNTKKRRAHDLPRFFGEFREHLSRSVKSRMHLSHEVHEIKHKFVKRTMTYCHKLVK